MQKRFSRGWLLACVVACINGYPASHDKRASTFRLNSNLGEFSGNDYDFEDFSGEKYVDGRDESSVATLKEDGGSGASAEKAQVRLPLKLEPDAEMLPAHYTSVDPPGVDHMEIVSFDSSGMSSNSENTVAGGTKVETGSYGVSGGETLGEETGLRTGNEFEKRVRMESGKENRKGEYDEATGKKRTDEKIGEKLNGLELESSDDKGVKGKLEARRHKGHNAAGYRNVYHKDEYKKDADFYDNDQEGGRFRKHGHYDEKHVVTESDFRNDGNRASKSSIAEAEKKGNFEVKRVGEESKGRRANSGYDVFFDKFNEFASKKTRNGQWFGDNGKPATVRR